MYRNINLFTAARAWSNTRVCCLCPYSGTRQRCIPINGIACSTWSAQACHYQSTAQVSWEYVNTLGFLSEANSSGCFEQRGSGVSIGGNQTLVGQPEHTLGCFNNPIPMIWCYPTNFYSTTAIQHLRSFQPADLNKNKKDMTTIQATRWP